MSTDRDLRDFILDIRDSINDIRSFVLNMIHEYFGVDLEIVWQTIQCDLTEPEEGIHHME